MIAALLLALSAGQLSAEDARLPRVAICTGQAAYFDREWGLERPDGSVWWVRRGRTEPFDASRETTARQRPWFRAQAPLDIDGVTYGYRGVAQPDSLPFRRYHRDLPPVDGVPAVEPMGSEGRVIWLLLDPVDCLFAVWERQDADRDPSF